MKLPLIRSEAYFWRKCIAEVVCPERPEHMVPGMSLVAFHCVPLRPKSLEQNQKHDIWETNKAPRQAAWWRGFRVQNLHGRLKIDRAYQRMIFARLSLILTSGKRQWTDGLCWERFGWASLPNFFWHIEQEIAGNIPEFFISKRKRDSAHVHLSFGPSFLSVKLICMIVKGLAFYSADLYFNFVSGSSDYHGAQHFCFVKYLPKWFGRAWEAWTAGYVEDVCGQTGVTLETSRCTCAVCSYYCVGMERRRGWTTLPQLSGHCVHVSETDDLEDPVSSFSFYKYNLECDNCLPFEGSL